MEIELRTEIKSGLSEPVHAAENIGLTVLTGDYKEMLST
jgi:hypothetical protein